MHVALHSARSTSGLAALALVFASAHPRALQAQCDAPPTLVRIDSGARAGHLRPAATSRGDEHVRGRLSDVRLSIRKDRPNDFGGPGGAGGGPGGPGGAGGPGGPGGLGGSDRAGRWPCEMGQVPVPGLYVTPWVSDLVMRPTVPTRWLAIDSTRRRGLLFWLFGGGAAAFVGVEALANGGDGTTSGTSLPPIETP